MRKTTWAILGSLVINLVLGLGLVAVFSVSPQAKAADLPGCSAQAAARTRPTPAPPARPGHRYIVAVRMGWAM